MRRVYIVLIVGVLAVITYYTLPWRAWAEYKLIALLEARGISPARFTVKGFGLRGLELENVSIGEPAYRVQHLSVSYSLNALLRNDTSAPITLTSDALDLRIGTTPIKIGNLELVLIRQNTYTMWDGTWKAEGITAEDETLTLPPLKGSGTLHIAKEKVQATGNFADVSNTHTLSGQLNYALHEGTPSELKIAEARMPISDGGIVALTKTTLPIGGDKPITLVLNVRKVNVETLLKALGIEEAKATGVVSGSIPITRSVNGAIHLGKGALNADQPGVITLPPDTIPGDNPQVNLVREVIKNLHYNVLSLSLASDKNGNILAKLAVEGNNPDVERGRPIKLNVQLSGDLLNLLLQNMQLLSDPKTFIEQNTHETSP